MPDVWRYMDFLRESFEELRDATRRATPPREVVQGGHG
jgi:hypothetical protein